MTLLIQNKQRQLIWSALLVNSCWKRSCWMRVTLQCGLIHWMQQRSILVRINAINYQISNELKYFKYIEHLLQYVTTMVCVAVQGKPTIGVIHEPFTGVTYWGWSNNGVSQHLSSKNVSQNILNGVAMSSASHYLFIIFFFLHIFSAFSRQGLIYCFHVSHG